MCEGVNVCTLLKASDAAARRVSAPPTVGEGDAPSQPGNETLDPLSLVGWGAGASVPSMVLSHPINARLDWDLGSFKVNLLSCIHCHVSSAIPTYIDLFLISGIGSCANTEIEGKNISCVNL